MNKELECEVVKESKQNDIKDIKALVFDLLREIEISEQKIKSLAKKKNEALRILEELENEI